VSSRVRARIGGGRIQAFFSVRMVVRPGPLPAFPDAAATAGRWFEAAQALPSGPRTAQRALALSPNKMRLLLLGTPAREPAGCALPLVLPSLDRAEGVGAFSWHVLDQARVLLDDVSLPACFNSCQWDWRDHIRVHQRFKMEGSYQLMGESSPCTSILEPSTQWPRGTKQ
jgi:hypothetical protein